MAKRVLIVDDAIFMRNMIKDIFAGGGFEVVGEAANGLEAVQITSTPARIASRQLPFSSPVMVWQ